MYSTTVSTKGMDLGLGLDLDLANIVAALPDIVKVFPMTSREYFEVYPLNHQDFVAVYDFTGAMTRYEFIDMAGVDVPVRSHILHYYPIGCLGEYTFTTQFYPNPRYNPMWNVCDDRSIIKSVYLVDFKYKHMHCEINAKLLESEKRQYMQRVGDIIAFIKGRYYTNPPAEWTLEAENDTVTDTTSYHINKNTIQVVQPNKVEKVVKALKLWYVMNGFELNNYDIDLLDLDTIRKVRF